jgi:Domain of unknown function (DUF4159)
MQLPVGALSDIRRVAGRRAISAAVALVLLLALAGYAAAQRRRFFNDFAQNQPEPSNTEFVFARVQFHTGYSGYGFVGGNGWSHDYPTAEHHILDLASRLTRIHVQEQSYIIVQLESEEIFEYPFLYFSEVGEMNLTPQEIENFREYLGRGGIAMIDDFDSPQSLAWFAGQMRKVFPERDFEEMLVEHPIFHEAFDVETAHVVPPYQYGYPPKFYGYFDDRRRLGMIINHNNDIGDFWEWLDQPRLPLQGTIAGVRLGINYLLYSMSH